MQTELPDEALLARYSAESADSDRAHYTDCFSCVVPVSVTLRDYVFAFYTAPLFRCERAILRLIGRGSSDTDVIALVDDEAEDFAAWSVEARAADQLLMCDFRSQTRSWFMVRDTPDGSRLFFGSAVIAANHDGPPKSYRVLLPLHRLYSEWLLRGAQRQVVRNARRRLHQK